MAVLEMHVRPTTRPALDWSEVCATEHGGVPVPARLSAPGSTPETGRDGAPARPVRRRTPSGSRPGGAPTVRGTGALSAPVAPGRRVAAAPVTGVRSCRVSAAPAAMDARATVPASVRVVDDVPTWVLLVCGVVFGIVMLLALAFVGGPAYV